MTPIFWVKLTTLLEPIQLHLGADMEKGGSVLDFGGVKMTHFKISPFKNDPRKGTNSTLLNPIKPHFDFHLKYVFLGFFLLDK